MKDYTGIKISEDGKVHVCVINAIQTLKPKKYQYVAMFFKFKSTGHFHDFLPNFEKPGFFIYNDGHPDYTVVIDMLNRRFSKGTVVVLSKMGPGYKQITEIKKFLKNCLTYKIITKDRRPTQERMDAYQLAVKCSRHKVKLGIKREEDAPHEI